MPWKISIRNVCMCENMNLKRMQPSQGKYKSSIVIMYGTYLMQHTSFFRSFSFVSFNQLSRFAFFAPFSSSIPLHRHHPYYYYIFFLPIFIFQISIEFPNFWHNQQRWKKDEKKKSSLIIVVIEANCRLFMIRWHNKPNSWRTANTIILIRMNGPTDSKKKMRMSTVR